MIEVYRIQINTRRPRGEVCATHTRSLFGKAHTPWAGFSTVAHNSTNVCRIIL